MPTVRPNPSNLITTKSGTLSNAYIDTDYCEAYFKDTLGYDDWFDAERDDMKRAILTATKMIDRLPVNYERLNASQALRFPVYFYDEAETTINTLSADGWEEVRKACAEQAYWLWTQMENLKEAAAGRTQSITSSSAQGFSNTSVGYNAYGQYASEVYTILTPYLDFNIRLVRG